MELSQTDYIHRYYKKATNSEVTMAMYLGLRDKQVLSITLLQAVARVQLQPRWEGMKTKDITYMIDPQEATECSATSETVRLALRTTEAMCLLHPTPMHYSVVIALRQASQVVLIWCDSLKRDGRQAMKTYSQYYHFLETDSQCFRPNGAYTSPLTIRTITPALPMQDNDTDCGIFTLMYQKTLSDWYGDAAGQEFTEVRINALIRELEKVTNQRATEYRKWLRIHMHTWWKGNWNEILPVLPSKVGGDGKNK